MTTSSFLLALLITLIISTLTLLTGFGVGTVLTPVFTFFYEVKTAVFLVAIVHLVNNALKFSLFAKHIDRKVFKRFGLVSILGALAGSFLQGSLNSSYVKIFLALFLLASGISELLPKKLDWKFPRRFDVLGGFFSGLMGGLIGNQGAIRSAYLLNYELPKEAFIATATSIAILIDLSRIPVYFQMETVDFRSAAVPLLIVTLVAFAGTLIGKELLKKISLERFRKVVALAIIAFAVILFVHPTQ